MQAIRKPLRNDVISGRGNGANLHPGNVYFRSLVATHKASYLAATAREKKEIKRQIVYHIQNVSDTRSTAGRFLTKKATGLWKCVSEKEALKKTGQALREDAPRIRSAATANEHHPPQDRPENDIARSLNHRNEDNNNNNSTNPMSATSLAASLDMMDLNENEPVSNGLNSSDYRFQSLSGTELVLDDERGFQFGEHKSRSSDNGNDDQSTQSMDVDRSSIGSEFFPGAIRPPLSFIQNRRFINLSGTSMSLRSNSLEGISFRSITSNSMRSNSVRDYDSD